MLRDGKSQEHKQLERNEDVVLATLKRRYFEAAQREDYPRTPAITRECDHLEEAIRKLDREKND